MYRTDMIECLEKYIECEFNNSIYYNELAKMAPSTNSKNLLLNLSNDEKSHTERLLQAHYYIANKVYLIKPAAPPIIAEYSEGLKTRMFSESEEYKKYGTHCIEEKSEYLRALFFLIRSSEAQHVMRIPILLDECVQNSYA